jgi:hypothetical protein
MAPQAVHAPPHQQLVELGKRARDRGLTFAEFWTEAVREGLPLIMTNHKSPPAGAVRWPTDRNDRRAWMGAIVTTRESWQRNYERLECPPHERALRMLGDSIGAIDRAAAAAGRENTDGIGVSSRVKSAA